jgi:cell division protein FtsB
MRGGRRRSRVGWRKKILIGAGAAGFLILLVTSVFGRKGLLWNSRARTEYQAKADEIRKLELERERLEREIEELERNPLAVESEARERIWLVKPDEKVIVKKVEVR